MIPLAATADLERVPAVTHLQPAAQTVRGLILAPAHTTPDAPAILAPGR